MLAYFIFFLYICIKIDFIMKIYKAKIDKIGSFYTEILIGYFTNKEKAWKHIHDYMAVRNIVFSQSLPEQEKMYIDILHGNVSGYYYSVDTKYRFIVEEINVTE